MGRRHSPLIQPPHWRRQWRGKKPFEFPILSLLREQRRLLHACIVEALEALAGDRLEGQVERLAHHALGAPLERIFEHVRQTEAFAERLGDLRQIGQVCISVSGVFWMAADIDQALGYGQRALALAATLGDVHLQALASLRLGQLYENAGDYIQAAANLERNVMTLQGDLLTERFDSITIVAVSSRSWLCRSHAERGAFPKGLALVEEGIRIAETINNPFSLIEACRDISWLYLRWGDVHRAIPPLERALGLCEDWHVLLFMPWVTTLLGLAYTLAGRVTAGLTLAEQDVAQEVSRRRPQSLLPMLTQLSEAYLLAGRMEDARQRAAQALDLISQYQFRGIQARAVWLLGESMARQASPQVEPATDYYRQALALAEELGMRPLQAHCHYGLGALYA